MSCTWDYLVVKQSPAYQVVNAHGEALFARHAKEICRAARRQVGVFRLEEGGNTLRAARCSKCASQHAFKL